MTGAARPPGRFDGVLERLFRLRPGEARRAFAMSAYLMGVVSTFIIGRNVRDTLFLSRAELSFLPYMYVAVAASVAPASFIYSRLADRARRDRVIQRSLFTFAAVLFAFWAALLADLGGRWVYGLLYIVVEIIGAISIIQFWTFAQDLYDSREGKRLFGFIGAGGVLSNVSCGFAIKWAVPLIGSEALLLVAVVLLVGCGFIVASIGRDAAAVLEPLLVKPKPKTGARAAEGAGTIASDRYLLLIAALVALTFVTVSIVDYQFKIVAKRAYSETELSAFFGSFFAYTGIVASIMQFFVTSRLLERRGIAMSLGLLPLGLAVGASAMLLPAVGLFAAAIVAKGAENIFRYTVNDASTQLLYVPVPAHLRARAKAFIDGMLKPFSIGAAGLLLALLGKLRPAETLAQDLAYLDLALLAAWMFVVAELRGEYLSALMKTLRHRRLDISSAYRPLDDAATIELLRRGLGSQVEAEVLAALDLVPAVDGDFGPELVRLLDGRSKAIRLGALEHLSRTKLAGSAQVRALLDDADDEIRSAATLALAAGAPASVVDFAVARLDDPMPRVRASAVIAAWGTDRPDLAARARSTLDALRTSEAPDARAEAARAIGALAAPLEAELGALVDDPRTPVRIAAIRAVAAKHAVGLAPKLVECLGAHDTEGTAIRAMVELGTAIEPMLTRALGDESLDPALRRRIPKVLALIGDQKTLDGLVERLDAPDTELVLAVARAAAKLRTRVPGALVDEERLDRALSRELAEAYQLLAILEDLGPVDDPLLTEALRARHVARLEVAFRLLGLRHPPKTLQLVWLNLEADNKVVRANALEVADNVLSKEESRLLFPLLEDRPTADKVRAGEALFELTRRSPDEWLRALVGHPHPWVVACALHATGTKQVRALRAEVASKLDAKDAVVRETATWALERLDVAT